LKKIESKDKDIHVFQFSADTVYWIDGEGAKHRITKAGICANGVRDLCIYWQPPKPYDVRVGKIVDIPKDRILLIPKGDILWVNFEPPLADGQCAFYVDIAADPSGKNIVREMLRRGAGKKGSDYEMFGGDQYI